MNLDFDASKFYLGKLCGRNHDFANSFSLRTFGRNKCVECIPLDIAEWRAKNQIELTCKYCKNQFQKRTDQVKDWKGFCGHSCNSKWQNKNKAWGDNRSALEL